MLKQNIIIVDLDGTLANCSLRKPHIEKTPKDWEAFYKTLTDDTVNEWCAAIVKSFEEQGVASVFITGRMEKYRTATEMWLKYHGIEYRNLLMRKDGDFRQDWEIKQEIYDAKIKSNDNINVLFCIDDRQQVVDMWRRNGLVCLQCDKGNF